MPKKPVFNQKDKYLLFWSYANIRGEEYYYSAASAVNAYRHKRKEYGDNVCLLKVVVDYGEEI